MFPKCSLRDIEKESLGALQGADPALPSLGCSRGREASSSTNIFEGHLPSTGNGWTALRLTGSHIFWHSELPPAFSLVVLYSSRSLRVFLTV